MGPFDDARRYFADLEVTCPHCGARDLPTPAKPTIEREPDGSYSCTTCAHAWRKEQTA
jgi:DNA-directed RNA polymerase subunit RPC12/RpoP